jgi:hypothetical protein
MYIPVKFEPCGSNRSGAMLRQIWQKSEKKSIFWPCLEINISVVNRDIEIIFGGPHDSFTGSITAKLEPSISNGSGAMGRQIWPKMQKVHVVQTSPKLFFPTVLTILSTYNFLVHYVRPDGTLTFFRCFEVKCRKFNVRPCLRINISESIIAIVKIFGGPVDKYILSWPTKFEPYIYNGSGARGRQIWQKLQKYICSKHVQNHFPHWSEDVENFSFLGTFRVFCVPNIVALPVIPDV